jgi:hypothetical protein
MPALFAHNIVLAVISPETSTSPLKKALTAFKSPLAVI